MNHPLQVDVIILEWNRPEHTIAAIESALAQRGVVINVIVIDQASAPAQRAQLAQFCEGQSRVSVVWLERNIGVAAGRNLATRLGTAEYVVALDNDAVFADRDCVARAVARLAAEPELGALAFRVLDADTAREQVWDYPRGYLGAQLESFEVTRFVGGAYALRRAAFERAGGYDERLFFSGEERDLSWRMIQAGYRLRWYRDLAIYHRHVPTGKLTWSDRRFFYTVRNTLYIDQKFGAGALGFLRGAGAFFLRGLRNGLGATALQGIVEGFVMTLRFACSAEDKAAYRLSPEARRYIAHTDRRDDETDWQRLMNHFAPLPDL